MSAHTYHNYNNKNESENIEGQGNSNNESDKGYESKSHGSSTTSSSKSESEEQQTNFERIFQPLHSNHEKILSINCKVSSSPCSSLSISSDIEDQSNLQLQCKYKSDEYKYQINEFKEQSIQSIFVRKVFSTIIIQMVVIAGIVAIILFEFNINRLFTAGEGYHFHLIWIGLGIFAFAVGIYLTEILRKSSLNNLIFLLILSFACGIEIGGITASFGGGGAILSTITVVCVICLTLVLLSFQNKWDFECFKIGVISVSFIILLICVFCVNKKWRDTEFSLLVFIIGLSAILFCVFLTYDLKRLMDGQSVYPNEYFSAALSISTDIILIIMVVILTAFAAPKGRNQAGGIGGVF